VTRPAASSGTNGSGIELQYINYKGKTVIRQAHVPILNVKYDEDACGPYRDWQYEEGMIEADGDDVVPGFRLCSTPAKTILDSRSDQGNFLGVAVYVDRQEVVLVSEMEAGWYRYISEWRLHANGTIKPRFGFAAVNNSCVCNTHHHHVCTSELLRFTIRHILNQLSNQPEYLILKQQHQKGQNNQQQQQIHSQVILPSTNATSHQSQVSNISRTNNLVRQKMTPWKSSSLLSTQTNHHNTLWW
jgi:hypothetical protein